MLQTTTTTTISSNCPTSHRGNVCLVLPVWKPLVHVHVDQHCQVMYVAHLGGLQGVDLELGHRFFPECVIATLFKLPPQRDGVVDARPTGHSNLHMAIRQMFACRQVGRNGGTAFAESRGACSPDDRMK